MTTAPVAVRSTEDPRDVARALVSSPLPLPTTTRLWLLSLVACAGASFTTWWWLVLGRGNWPGAHTGCLPTAPAAPDAVLDRFTGCVHDVRLAQSAVVLCGPLALLALALLWRAAVRRLSLWWWQAAPDTSELRALLDSVQPEGAGARPTLWVRHRRVGVRARAWGTRRDPWIVADSHVFNLPDDRTRAMFRHELAHLRLRDVGRVRLATAAWWILLIGCTVPVGVTLALEPRVLGTGLLVRMALVLLIVGLSLRSVLRVREYDADLCADSDPRAPDGAAAALIGSGNRPSRRERLLARAGLATHPTPASRLHALAHPAWTWGLSPFACLATGLGAGLVLTDLALLVGALAPTRTQLAYTVAGALTGWAVSGVVTVAWWRAVAVENRAATGWRPAIGGAVLGIGVLLGSQLSGRAAGEWVRDTWTAEGLATALSLTDVPFSQAAALAAALVAGGALFGVWTTSLARAARAAVSGPRSAPACAAAVVLSGLLTAVPLGSWFLFARLTAARQEQEIRWSVIDTPWWVTGVAVTVVGALLPMATRRAGRRASTSDEPVVRRARPIAVLVAAAVVVTAGAVWATVGGEFDERADPPSWGSPRSTAPRSTGVARTPEHASASPEATTASPGAPVTGVDETVPLDELPDLPPPGERTPQMRADPALVCRALTLGGTVIWNDPLARRETAELLGGVDDIVLRSASAVLRRDPYGPVDRDALIASFLRCDLYFRYHR
ncbi:M48 family metalloprotease [Streptomyces sp. NPDC002309]